MKLDYCNLAVHPKFANINFTLPKVFTHITYIFHPDMGYDINLMVKHFSKSYKNIIITSADVSLWNENSKTIAAKDKLFEDTYDCRIYRLPYFKWKKNQTAPLILGISKLLRSLKSDIVFTHGIESISYALSLPAILKYNGKVGFDTHTLYNQVEKASLLWRCYIRWYIKPYLIRKINRRKIPVFYTAKDNRHFLAHYLGISENIIHSNEIATDVKVFYPHKDEALEKQYRKTEDEKIALYVGKFDNFKNPHLILDAMQIQSKSTHFPVHLLFAGPKNEIYFHKHFNHLPEMKNVRISILPALPNHELHRYYSLADVVVIPEQNSLSALDAQACKTPVIMQDDPTNRERLKHGGMLYNAGNLEDLGSKIIEILSNDSLRLTLGMDGYEYVLKEYNYSNQLNNIIKLFI